MPGQQRPTSNTTLYRFWKPIMPYLYENCMTLALLAWLVRWQYYMLKQGLKLLYSSW
jgi:hypothetical protein